MFVIPIAHLGKWSGEFPKKIKGIAKDMNIIGYFVKAYLGTSHIGHFAPQMY